MDMDQLGPVSYTHLNELHIPVYVAENALRCVAEGTGILLENLHLVQ